MLVCLLIVCMRTSVCLRMCVCECVCVCKCFRGGPRGQLGRRLRQCEYVNTCVCVFVRVRVLCVCGFV